MDALLQGRASNSDWVDDFEPLEVAPTRTEKAPSGNGLKQLREVAYDPKEWDAEEIKAEDIDQHPTARKLFYWEPPKSIGADGPKSGNAQSGEDEAEETELEPTPLFQLSQLPYVSDPDPELMETPRKIEMIHKRTADSRSTAHDRPKFVSHGQTRFDNFRKAIISTKLDGGGDDDDSQDEDTAMDFTASDGPSKKFLCVGTLGIKNGEHLRHKADTGRKRPAETEGESSKKAAKTSLKASPADGQTEVVRPPGLRVRFVADSQWPYIHLELNRDNEPRSPKVNAFIYGQSLEYQENGRIGFVGTCPYGEDDLAGRVRQMQRCPTGNRELQIACQAGALWEVSVTLNSENNAWDKIRWSGITKPELDRLGDHWMDSNKPTVDRVIGLLATRIKKFTIWVEYRSFWEQDQRVNFTNWFSNLLWWNVGLGHLWYYKLEARRLVAEGKFDMPSSVPLRDVLMLRNFPFDLVKPPRWLVRAWTLQTNKKDQQKQDLVPKYWDSLKLPGHFPDYETSLFLNILALERTRDALLKRVDDLISDSEGRICTATFHFEGGKHPKEGVAFVRWANPEAARGDIGSDTGLQVESNTKLKLHVPALQYDVRDTIDGITIDDVTTSSADILVYIRGPMVTKLAEDVESGREYQVVLKWISDPTSINRRIAGLLELAEGHSDRKIGIDLRWFCFGGSRVQESGQGLIRALSNRKKRQWVTAVSKRKSGIKLNPIQRDAAVSPITCSRDQTILWTPAGCGKSEVSAAMAEGAIAAGLKVAIVGATHGAVDECLKKALPNFADGVEVLRFKGKKGRPKTSREQSKQGGEDTAEDQSAAESEVNWDVIAHAAKTSDMPHSDLYFQPRFDAWLQAQISESKARRGRIASQAERANPESEPAELALSKFELFVRYHNELESSERDISKGDRDTAKYSMEELRHELERMYLRECVRVLACTCSAAAHEDLDGLFSPDIIIVEEAGQCAVSDVSQVFARLGHKALHLWLSGDPKQNGPMVVERDCNEGGEVLEMSILEIAMHDLRFNDDVKMMKLQYRARSGLADLPSRIWYNGELASHTRTVDMEQGFDIAMSEFLKSTFGTAWSGGPHIGLDTSSGRSANFAKTKSWCNETEAQALVNFLQKALAFQPKRTEYRMRASDFGILTPYSGQRLRILAILCDADNKNGANRDVDVGQTLEVFEAGVEGMEGVHAPTALSGVDVKTTVGAQGAQWKCTLVSTVMNVPFSKQNPYGPANIGWVKNSSLLCVMFSRAQRFQITFGNFAGWRQMQKSFGSLARESYVRTPFKTFKKVVEYFFEGKGRVIAEVEQGRLTDEDASLPLTSNFLLHADAQEPLPAKSGN